MLGWHSEDVPLRHLPALISGVCVCVWGVRGGGCGGGGGVGGGGGGALGGGGGRGGGGGGGGGGGDLRDRWGRTPTIGI